MIKVERIDGSDKTECIVMGKGIEIGAELIMIFEAILMRADDEHRRKFLANQLHRAVDIAYVHFDDIEGHAAKPANTDAENYSRSILGSGTDD